MPSKPRWPDWPEALPRDWRRQAAALMAGVDEAGRGPLAGPVVAAAVLLDESRPIAGLDDSKVLTTAQRERLDEAIRDRALCLAVAEASVEEIDALNILRASLLAMRRAVEALGTTPLCVLVDGNQLPPLALPMHAIVGGDARVKAISAASIIAKVHRDRLCRALHERHPEYGFDRHKGYPSPAHLAALRLHGACAVHRRSYAPVRAVLAAAAALATNSAGVSCGSGATTAEGPLATNCGDGNVDGAAVVAAASIDFAPPAASAAAAAVSDPAVLTA